MKESIDYHSNPEELQCIFKALAFSAHYHRYQKRKGAEGIPYINHPIEVANHLIKHLKNCKTELILAALLHDTLEDTEAAEEDLAVAFGKEVLQLVLEVTDDKALSSAQRKQLQVEHARHLSPQAQALKLADKTCNIRDVITTRLHWSRHRKIQYVQWALEVVTQFQQADASLVKEFERSVKLAEEHLNHSFTR